MYYFDDEELSTEQMQDIIAKEREEKYKKLEQMTEDERLESLKEKSLRAQQYANKIGMKIDVINTLKNKEGE